MKEKTDFYTFHFDDSPSFSEYSNLLIHLQFTDIKSRTATAVTTTSTSEAEDFDLQDAAATTFKPNKTIEEF